MGQFLCALKLIPPAPRLIVVRSFTLVGQRTSAPTRLFFSLLWFPQLLDLGSLIPPQLVSDEFVTRQVFSNSVTRIFFALRPHHRANTHTRIGGAHYGD
jgi:hypothetical protein